MLAYVVHPSTTALAAARQIVSREDAEQIATFVCNLISRDNFRVVRRHVLQLFHIYAVECVGGNEDAFHNVLEFEVRLCQFFIEVVFLLAHLLGIVPPVPRFYLAASRKFACRNVLVHQLLHIIDLLFCLGYGSNHDVSEESIDSLSVVSHLRLQNIGGRIIIAHNLCLLNTKTHDVKNELTVVELVAVVATHGVGLKHLLTEGTVLCCRHRIGIVRDADAKLLLEGIAFGEDVVAQLLRLCGHLRIDLTKTGLLLFGKAYAITFESLEALLQHHLLLTTELTLVGKVNLGNTIVKPFVERDVVLVLSKHRNSLLHNGVEFVCAVCLANVVQHT